ncbi:large ribosomal subunit protein P2A [Monosporozyma servazzii]
MKYLAAYLLLNAAGNTTSAENVKSVLSSVGIEIDEERVNALIAAVEGKSIEELIQEGNTKLSAVPAAGPASGASGSAAASGEAAADEDVEEEKEESDDDMGFGLFD